MASTVTFRVSPFFTLNPETKPRFRVRVIFSSDSLVVNGTSFGREKEKNGALIHGGIEDNRKSGNPIGGGKGNLNSSIEKRWVVSDDLEVLWDDGYGTKTIEDFLDGAKEIIRPDGGPPRAFEVRCLHIPLYDRTSFEALVKYVEETVRREHASSPDKPIYIVGDSFGGCLALAVAARNPRIDLVLILANRATSFERSQLQPLLPILEALPNELYIAVPYLLSFVIGNPMKMATVGIDNGLPAGWQSEQLSERLSANLTAFLSVLSGLGDIIRKDTLLWKLKLLKSAAAYANSRLHAVNAEVLVLAGDESKGEVANPELTVPWLLPKVPGRFDFLFRKPIRTDGREEILKDKESANQVYLEIKSEVKRIIDYLLKKREEDPYRNIIDRSGYCAFRAPVLDVPGFDP